MARLSAPFSLTGTFGELIAYQRKDLPQTVVRTPSSLSPARFYTDPSYANTRRTASEGGGRSKAAQALRRVLHPLSAVRDHNWQGALTGALTAVQKGDTESPWGERAVLLSLHGHLLEGYGLARRTPFETVVRAAALPRGQTFRQRGGGDPRPPSGANFFSPLTPSLFPGGGFAGCRARPAVYPRRLCAPTGGALPAPRGGNRMDGRQKRRPPTTLHLQLPHGDPLPSCALVLAVGLCFGTPDAQGYLQAATYSGCGRIARVV